MTAAAEGAIAAVIVAAGRGERAGGDNGPKQYRRIGGEAVIARTIRAFASHRRVGPIIVAIHADDEDLFAEAAGSLAARVRTVHGGASRQASVRAALAALSAEAPRFVLIHDGARPFVDAALIDRVADALDQGGGVIPAMAVSDTLKRVDDALTIVGTQPREKLYAAQTPQAFPFEAIHAAHERAAGFDPDGFTDDAALAEWAGIPVRVVEGSADNVKLTWARDIELADQRLLAERAAFPDIRTGTGYDVHCFGAGDRVILCGVAIAHDQALQGHSDADVGLHALTDALLATRGAGDIGSHFPPSDPQWRGADSAIFLRKAAEIVRAAGGRIANVDVTLIAEAPRIGPHRDAMVDRLAGLLAIERGRVSIKATTNEQLGFIGRREGIAAIASATVLYPGTVPA